MISFEDLPSLQDIGKEDGVQMTNMWLSIDIEYRRRHIVRSEPACGVNPGWRVSRTDTLMSYARVREMPYRLFPMVVDYSASLA